MRFASVALLAMVLACRTTAVRQAPASLRVTPLWGPVIGSEVIGGRVEDESAGTLLLVGGIDLIRLDLRARTAERRQLDLAAGESCWSLAKLDAGPLWTLKGRRTLARINREGRVLEQVALTAPHFGLFAAGNRLVYQEAVFTAPSAALQVGSPDGSRRLPWSSITTRPFPGLARASLAALNMVSCGLTRTGERPCWFPDEAAVFLVNSQGVTRHVALAGLLVVAPEALLTAENPARPVRDVVVEPDGELWVLSTGRAGDASDAGGGWVVARYGPHGEPRGASRLDQPARLILSVDARHVTLLLSSGEVGEIERW
jgi:hypothetical protein